MGFRKIAMQSAITAALTAGLAVCSSATSSEVSLDELKAAIERLDLEVELNKRKIEMKEIERRYQMITAPEYQLLKEEELMHLIEMERLKRRLEVKEMERRLQVRDVE